jgi:hypothetical protein
MSKYELVPAAAGARTPSGLVIGYPRCPGAIRTAHGSSSETVAYKVNGVDEISLLALRLFLWRWWARQNACSLVVSCVVSH